MKIVLYFFSLRGSAGGAERMIIDLATALDARGHAVRLVSWDEPGAHTYYAVPASVSWARLGVVRGPRKLRRTINLIGDLRRARPDLFVGFVMRADKSVYAACRVARIPLVAAERNAPAMYAETLSRVGAWFYLRLFGLCRGIAVQFDRYRDAYPAHLRERIVSIPNPVRPARVRSDPGKESPRKTVLAVGRLSHEKGHDVLIDAFAALAHRFLDWDLCIVGEGPERAALQGAIDRHGLGARVHLPGSTEHIERVYAGADVFVQPSRWEGFPNALAEALAHGLCAVGFARSAGVNELIRHGVNGLLADGRDDARSLADAMSTLMESAQRRREMGRAAVESMRVYEPGAIHDRWESFLQRCATARYTRAAGE